MSNCIKFCKICKEGKMYMKMEQDHECKHCRLKYKLPLNSFLAENNKGAAILLQKGERCFFCLSQIVLHTKGCYANNQNHLVKSHTRRYGENLELE